MTAPQRPASNSDARKRAEERALHHCSTCAACIHNGYKCCGCYDGVCCQASS